MDLPDVLQAIKRFTQRILHIQMKRKPYEQKWSVKEKN